MSFLGKKIRLERILDRKTKRTLTVTMDHAITDGVLRGIEDVRSTMEEVIEGHPNAITIHKGLVEQVFKDYAGRADISLLLKVASSGLFHSNHEVLFTSVEEAVRLGADGVSFGATLGGVNQPRILKNLGLISNKCERFGMPLIVHAYPKGEMIAKEDRFKPEHVSYAARTVAEVGADLVKTWYTGSPDTFREVVRSCPVPVVVAGGPKSSTTREFLETIQGSLGAGAVGAAVGRNIWQYQKPGLMIRAVMGIIHEELEVDEAMKVLES